jgi:hypothetical protein
MKRGSSARNALKKTILEGENLKDYENITSDEVNIYLHETGNLCAFFYTYNIDNPTANCFCSAFVSINEKGKCK